MTAVIRLKLTALLEQMAALYENLDLFNCVLSLHNFSGVSESLKHYIANKQNL